MGLYARVIDFAGMRMLRITDFTEQIIVCLFFLKVFPGDGLASEFPVFICLAFLLIKYFVLLVKTLYTRYRSIASPKVSSLIKRHKTRNLPHHHFYCCAIF